jgi:RNA polymerase sigma-70 factor (ECF subfamily)
MLYALQPSPVVELNAAVALSLAQGAEAGLAVLSALEAEGALEAYQPFHAARADLLRRVGRGIEAVVAYRRALALTKNVASRRFLQGRLREVGGG